MSQSIEITFQSIMSNNYDNKKNGNTNIITLYNITNSIV